MIKSHVFDKPVVGAWNWLKGNTSSSNGRTSENGVRANICANINKKIIASQDMEQKTHVRKFMQSCINVSG